MTSNAQVLEALNASAAAKGQLIYEKGDTLYLANRNIFSRAWNYICGRRRTTYSKIIEMVTGIFNPGFIEQLKTTQRMQRDNNIHNICDNLEKFLNRIKTSINPSELTNCKRMVATARRNLFKANAQLVRETNPQNDLGVLIPLPVAEPFIHPAPRWTYDTINSALSRNLGSRNRSQSQDSNEPSSLGSITPSSLSSVSSMASATDLGSSSESSESSSRSSSPIPSALEENENGSQIIYNNTRPAEWNPDEVGVAVKPEIVGQILIAQEPGFETESEKDKIDFSVTEEGQKTAVKPRWIFDETDQNQNAKILITVDEDKQNHVSRDSGKEITLQPPPVVKKKGFFARFRKAK